MSMLYYNKVIYFTFINKLFKTQKKLPSVKPLGSFLKKCLYVSVIQLFFIRNST